MTEFKYESNYLLLYYTPKNDIDWIKEYLNEEEDFIYIKKTFTFKKKDLLNLNFEKNEAIFILGVKQEEYYKINKEKLDCLMDVYFHQDCKINFNYFKYPHGGYIIENTFKIISSILEGKKEIYIGGNKADISIEDFDNIIKMFPNQIEREYYSKSRIFQVLENYFDISTNYTKKLENYRNRKDLTIKNSLKEVNEYEITKYEIILNKMKKMLDLKDKYSEKQWQKEILEIILLIFPKYIAVIDELVIPIKESNKKKEKLDYLLISNNGNIDVIEIKKPQVNNNDLLSKTTDHDNYYSTNFFAKASMQIEKYIYHLNKLGYNTISEIEKYNEKKIKENIPNDIILKSINPKGILIMGEDKQFNRQQKNDFEILKKMYANIIEIITYDDLINRLENTIKSIKGRCKNGIL